MSNRARKNILKVIVEQGLNGELHDDMEKAFVKKKRFKVFSLTKRVIWKVNLGERRSEALHTAKSGMRNTYVASSPAVQVFRRCSVR
jgi:hypothetical protein